MPQDAGCGTKGSGAKETDFKMGVKLLIVLRGAVHRSGYACGCSGVCESLSFEA